MGDAYSYGCNPYYRCCDPYSYPLNYPYDHCLPDYGYGGPALAVGFDDFAFDNDFFLARRDHDRHFFDDRRFVGFDRRFLRHDGFARRLMGGSMGHSFVHAGGFGGGSGMGAAS